MWGNLSKACSCLRPMVWLALSLSAFAQSTDSNQPTQGLRLKSGSNFIVTIAIDHPEQTARLVVTEPIPPNTGSTGAVAHFLPTVSGDRTFVKWVASSSSRVVKPVKSIPPGLPVFNFFVDNAADGTFTIHADFDSTDAFDPSLEGPRISSIVMEGGAYVEAAGKEPEATQGGPYVEAAEKEPEATQDNEGDRVGTVSPEPEHQATQNTNDPLSVRAVKCDSWPTDGSMTIFDRSERPAENNANNNMMGLVTGVLVRTDIAVEVTSIRYFKAASESGSPHTFTVYHNESQETLASYVFNDSACEGSQWVSVVLEKPLVTAPSESYLFSLHPLTFTAVTRGYFSRKAHAKKAAGGVTLVSGAFAHDGENLFEDLRQVPTWNFWLDLEFRPALERSGPLPNPTVPPSNSPAPTPAVHTSTPSATATPKLDPVEALRTSGPPQEILDALGIKGQAVTSTEPTEDYGERPSRATEKPTPGVDVTKETQSPTAPSEKPGASEVAPDPAPPKVLESKRPTKPTPTGAKGAATTGKTVSGTVKLTVAPSALPSTSAPSASAPVTSKPTLASADSLKTKPTGIAQASAPGTISGSKPTRSSGKAPAATLSQAALPAIIQSVQPILSTGKTIGTLSPTVTTATAVPSPLPATVPPSGRPTVMSSRSDTKPTSEKPPPAGSTLKTVSKSSTSPTVAIKTAPSPPAIIGESTAKNRPPAANVTKPPSLTTTPKPTKVSTQDIAKAAAAEAAPSKTRGQSTGESTAPVADSASRLQPSSTGDKVSPGMTNGPSEQLTADTKAQEEKDVPSPILGKSVPPTGTSSTWRSPIRPKKTLAPSPVDQKPTIKAPVLKPTDVTANVTCNSFPIDPEVATVFSAQDRPSAASHAENSSRVVVGVRLWTSVPTDVYSIRYYRAAKEGGEGHSAKIYEADTDELLVHVRFNDSSCTPAQWVDIPLPSPFRTRAQREYIVVLDSLVHYALSVRYFDAKAPKTVKSVSLLGSIFGMEPGAHPQRTRRSSFNYWLDFTFDAHALYKGDEGAISPAESLTNQVEPPKQSDAPTLNEPSSPARAPPPSKEATPSKSRVVTARVRSVGCDVFPLRSEMQTLFNRTEKPPREFPTTAAGRVVLGHVIAAVVPGNLTSFRFFKAKGEGDVDHSGRFYDAKTGQLLASVTFNATSCTAPAWVTARLAEPLHITPDHEYVVALDSVLYYPETQSYINGTLPRGSLRLLHSVYGSVLGRMPTRDDKKSTNYWIDVEFIRTKTGGADPSKAVNGRLMRRERRQRR